MAILKILPVFAAFLFGVGVYFMATDRIALGAAMFAIGSSQITIFAALLAAQRKRKLEGNP